jgi:hypothetical protein
MVQIYIKFTDNNYYLLDIEESEVINFKNIVKDLNDITKIFSPFTQSFNIQATDKNKRLLGFIGNEKIQRVNNDGKFDCLIYVSGFLFQSGKLSFEETNYNYKQQDKIKTNFASNLTGLTDKLGDITIQELFQDALGAYDDKLRIDWNQSTLPNKMQSTTSVTLNNGIEVKHNVPFISNKRVWNTDQSIDNITYNIARNNVSNNSIELDEVRPAVNYMAIMQHLLIKIGVPIVCPLFNSSELKDLMVLCTSEKLVTPNDAGYLLQPFSALQFTKSGFYNVPRWLITGGGASGVFKAKRNTIDDYPNSWEGGGFKVGLDFVALSSLQGVGTSIKVTLVNALNNAIIDSQDITTYQYEFTIIDNANQTMLDGNGELYFKFIIQPNTLLSWSMIEFKTHQRLLIGFTTSFFSSSFNNTSSADFGGNKINLISALPKMKAKDFLSSFFKMYNIQVINTGLQDGSMHWVTPKNIKEVNKAYSKRIVDYTQFVDTQTIVKKRGNEYNQYVFKHVNSKYYDAIYGNGTRFGELTYPTIAPNKPTKFEVATEYSIIKQNQLFNHPSGVKTALAFSREGITIGSNGGLLYTPIYEEFTLLYTKVIILGSNTIGVKLTDGQNSAVSQLLEPTFKHPTTGKTLAFGAEGIDTDDLYLNYYSDFIELLLNPNVYKSEFDINLPANEIFLNFSNQNQGENNIPTGFRPQNDIIIGEQRYTLVESLVNLTTGKGKLTLLNY